MVRAVLTGATGFVGSNLVRRLVRDGHDVHVLVRPQSSHWRLTGLEDRIHWHTVDLTDADAMRAVLKAIAPRWVFHLAVHGAYAWQVDMQAMVRTNILGTLTVAEASIAAGAEVIVNTGSSSEYGFKDHPPTESEAAMPNSAYAATKFAATLLLGELARRRDVPISTLRLYSVYGPFEEPARLIPTLLTCGIEGRLPELADPRIARDFVFVDDVMDAFVRVAESPPSSRDAIFNVGTGTQTTIGEIVSMARDMFEIAEQPLWGSFPNRDWDTHTWLSDSTQIRVQLSWSPRVGLWQGLHRFAAWLRDYPDFERYRVAALRGDQSHRPQPGP